MRRKHVLLSMELAPLALLAMPLLAAGSAEPLEIGGSMTGLLDGQEREWLIVREEGDSTATFTELGDHIKIELVGFVEGDVAQTRESLSLSITLDEGAVTGFDVLHSIGTTAMPPVFTSEGAAVELTLDAFEVSGNQAWVAGSVEGTLALQTELGADAVMDEGVAIAVEFDAEAVRIEY